MTTDPVPDRWRPERLGDSLIADRFEFIAGYDSGHGSKPAPGQLLAFADAIGVAPERIAMVGDATHDLEAARSAGMVAVGVLTGTAPMDVLSPLADVVLDDITQLAGWLTTR